MPSTLKARCEKAHKGESFRLKQAPPMEAVVLSITSGVLMPLDNNRTNSNITEDSRLSSHNPAYESPACTLPTPWYKLHTLYLRLFQSLDKHRL